MRMIPENAVLSCSEVGNERPAVLWDHTLGDTGDSVRPDRAFLLDSMELGWSG